MTSAFFASRLDSIIPSPTLAIAKLAAELKAQGKDIIPLSTGEPDFDTPDFIKEAAYAAIKAGKTKYTPIDGTPELKKAIVQKFKSENNLSYEVNQISVGAGGKQVIFNAFLATINPSDEVIIPSPYWVSYPDIVHLAGGTPVFLPSTPANNFKISPADLDKAITPKTKWFILNSPSNPTGSAYTKDELRQIADVLLKHPHVFILSDDIYEHLIYDNLAFYTIAQVEPLLLPRTLVVNGVSKAYSMTGWRIGYAAGDVELIKKMSDIQGHSTSNPSSISQAAAVGALTGDQSFLKDWVSIFQKRRDIALAALNSIEGLSCPCPSGAFYLFPDCGALFGKKLPSGKPVTYDSDIAGLLLEHGVAVVPGSAFGYPSAFRLSYAVSEDTLSKACSRIKSAISSLS
ncbi:MAG: pyridoxal phosphate-dependent aminotransferase [Alphaproteobacteria bacterium]|nr:pyridoxal phosphate-dependent aminotransferase [Alphaproteobacteria bacterium]MCL2505982.1 pyridoxal phosphate-dependent aminotransferase [Alphaproteobacteria bacterium]